MTRTARVRVEEFRLDDGVGDSGFVFQAQEQEPFGGARPLSADDAAGHPHCSAVLGSL